MNNPDLEPLTSKDVWKERTMEKEKPFYLRSGNWCESIQDTLTDLEYNGVEGKFTVASDLAEEFAGFIVDTLNEAWGKNNGR